MDLINVATGIASIAAFSFIVVVGLSATMDLIPTRTKPDNLAFYKARSRMESMIMDHEKQVMKKQIIAQCKNAADFI